MKRIDTSTAQQDKFGAGKDGFTNGNPAIPIPATDLDASWFDHVQEEIANVIEASGEGLNPLVFNQLLAAIRTLSAPRALAAGRLVWTSASQVAFARTHEGALAIEIDDVLLEKSDADVVFDITADLETGPEAASTWYHLYLENVAGVLTPHVSATPPVRDAAVGKVGYHPLNLGWRYIGAVYNDSASDFGYFQHVRPGEIWHEFEIGDAQYHTTTAPGAALTQVTPGSWFPLTARLFRWQIRLVPSDDAGASYEVALDPQEVAPSRPAGTRHVVDYPGVGSANLAMDHDGWSNCHEGSFWHRKIGNIGGSVPFRLTRGGFYDPFGA